MWRHYTTEQFATLLFFPLGGLLAMLLKKGPGNDPLWKSLGYVALGVLCWMGGGVIAQPDGYLLVSPKAALLGKAIIVIGTVLIFLGFRGSEANIWPRPLVYLGKISFGLYVFHNLAFAFVTAGANAIGLVKSGPGHVLTNEVISVFVILPVTLMVTIGAASLSYRYLETPFLRQKERFSVVYSRGV